MVVLSNLYIVVTCVLGMTLLNESVTVVKIGGLVLTLGGVLVLVHPPSSRYAVHSANSVAKQAPPARAFLVIGGYVVISKQAARRLSIIRHAEEVSGNVAMTCRYFGIRWCRSRGRPDNRCRPSSGRPTTATVRRQLEGRR